MLWVALTPNISPHLPSTAYHRVIAISAPLHEPAVYVGGEIDMLFPDNPFQYLAACARFCGTWDECCSRCAASCPVHHHCIVSIDHQSLPPCLFIFFHTPFSLFPPSSSRVSTPSLSPFSPEGRSNRTLFPPRPESK